MSKNPDGKNKSGKGSNRDKKEVVAKAAKPKVVKPKGPSPASYVPRAKNSETTQTLEGAWNGYHGLVQIKEMQFRFYAETSESGEKTNRVCLVHAPMLTKLAKLDGTKASINLDCLKGEPFTSEFEEGDKRYEEQVMLWKFLNRTFADAGFKPSCRKKSDAQAVPAEVEHKHEEKTSASVADFNSRKQGLYRFDTSVPYAIFSVEDGAVGCSAPQFGNPASSHLVIKLVSVCKGHPLSDCMIGTYLHYGKGLFRGKTPAFSGPHAKDCAALYEYLAGVRSLYRRSMVDKLTTATPASEGVITGERVDAVLQAA